MTSRNRPLSVPPPQQPGESLRAANARMRAANRVIGFEDMRQRQAAMEARLQRPPGMNLPPMGAPPREPMGPEAMGEMRPREPNERPPTGLAVDPVFKKGGPVKAKAPVKKKAGGMIAKPKAAAAAKPKGKAMPAFKKGGAVKGKR